MKPKEKVFVAMSGGVDSSVSAALLSEQGYEVTGVFIRAWHPDWLECSWKTERHDAMRVCAQLTIPFETLDLSKEYKSDVVDYLIKEYTVGCTPNPDVMCNKHIKFGAFLDWAQHQGANYIATGHYAQIQKGEKGYDLLCGNDQEKDQSYFLWTLTQEVLSKTFFPVGSLEKKKVRALAEKYKLPVATKKDSQGICFLGKIQMREFLRRYIDTKPGDVLDVSGNVVGTHEGAMLYTMGQRHGFAIDTKTTSSKPHYVIRKDVEGNTITVATQLERNNDETSKDITLESVNWIRKIPQKDKVYQARIRYRQPLQTCTITQHDPAQNTAVVSFTDQQRGAASGQSAVFYDDAVCLGGGVVY